MTLFLRLVVLNILLLFFTTYVFANTITDTTTHVIKWENNRSIVVAGKYKPVLTFYTSFHHSQNDFLPTYLTVIKDAYVVSVEVVDVELEDISDSEQKLIPNPASIGTTPKITLYHTIERKRYNTKVEILPLQRNGITGRIQKLKSFRLKHQLGSAPTAAARSVNQKRMESISSVLSSGNWYKLGFKESGIYKIDYKYLLTLGLDPSKINPAHIQIWGNGGGMLPESIEVRRASDSVDLVQNPIYVSGAEDGEFNEKDYVLFYVKGPVNWTLDEEAPYFTAQPHLYSNYCYYFLTLNPIGAKRIEKQIINNDPIVFYNSFTNYAHYENDSRNFLFSGRKWYGEEFDSKLNHSGSINSYRGIVGGTNIYLISSFLNKSTAGFSAYNYFDVSLNNSPAVSHRLSGGEAGVYEVIGYDGVFVDSFKVNSPIQIANFSFTYRKVGGSGIGYLDYYTINWEENLSYISPFNFRQPKTRFLYDEIIQYSIKKSPEIRTLRVWDVTKPNEITEADVVDLGSEATFKAVGDPNNPTVREYIAFDKDEFSNPISFETVKNQNVRGKDVPELLIITHPDFLTQANKLAEFRSNHDKMEVAVVTTEEIYNEFSSGATDLVALRDCARMFYKKDTYSKFKYILLFGDCSYDYKNIRNLSNPQNFVPVYESVESLHPVYTYSSDDYIGMLDDNEGNWLYNDDIDVGIGRVPVKTAQEAEIAVEKIINYSTNTNTLGAWRQNMVFIADNGDDNIFLSNAEQLSDLTELLAPDFNPKKVYLAAYKKEVSGTSPAASAKVLEEINEGTFILNYIGHGGETRVSSEDVITLSTIQSLTNATKLPFVVTATCDFGKYDDPAIVSGGEQFFIQPNGGAIGLLTTTRPVYQHSNANINDKFHRNVFKKETTGEYRRLGDIHRDSKNTSVSGTNNRNFALLGDPSLRLNYPKLQVQITSINGNQYDPVNRKDTIKALGKVTMSGSVIQNGTLASDFNGVVDILILDKEAKVRTIEEPIAPFNIQESKIFNGSATVKNGVFTFSFVVPKNINYVVGNGKISLYANVEDGRILDAGGSENNILIGSSDSSNAGLNNEPPQVKVYLNDETFISGGFTNENPTLLVKLYDENGISTVQDIGISLTAIINDDLKNPIVLDNYYKSDRDNYKSGTIRYKLTNLQEGRNTVSVKAFDTKLLGNSTNTLPSSSGTKFRNGELIDFVVRNYDKLSINNVYNYPNPFTTHTTFHFDHNRAGDFLDIMVQVYTVTGKLVKTLSYQTPYANSHIGDISWDGKDEWGDNIGRGVYVYKVSIKSLSDGKQKEQFEKLVILN